MDSPIEYPVVTVNGRALTVKLSLYAQLYLSRRKISLPDAMGRLVKVAKRQPGESIDPEIIADSVDLWTACVAENFARLNAPVPDADYWALNVPDGQWGECCKAVGEALAKAVRPAVQPLAPAAELPATLN